MSLTRDVTLMFSYTLSHCGHPRRWRGDYGQKKQGLFPANYVEEMEDDLSNSQPLGALQQDSINLTGVTVGAYPV